MGMPSNYKSTDRKKSRNLLMENGFVNMLRQWSEKLSDGFSRENLPPANPRNQFMPAFSDNMKWTPEERDKLITDEVLRTAGPAHEGKGFLISLTPEEWEDFSITAFYGFGLILPFLCTNRRRQTHLHIRPDRISKLLYGY